MKETSRLIITITLCICAVFFTVGHVWKSTRRSSDEWATINQSKYRPSENIPMDKKIESCIEGGGMPDYYEGVFSDCKKNE